MSTLASLRIVLGIDSAEVQAGARRVRGEMGEVSQSAEEARRSLGLVGNEPIDVKVNTEQLDAAAGDAQRAADDMQASMNDSAMASGSGFEQYMGKSFSSIAAKFGKGIVLAVTAMGIEEIKKAWEELNRVAGLIQMPLGDAKDQALIAELDKQIAGVSGALIQIPGQLDGLKAARQAIIDAARARLEQTAVTRDYIASEQAAAHATSAAAASQKELGVDILLVNDHLALLAQRARDADAALAGLDARGRDVGDTMALIGGGGAGTAPIFMSPKDQADLVAYWKSRGDAKNKEIQAGQDAAAKAAADAQRERDQATAEAKREADRRTAEAKREADRAAAERQRADAEAIRWQLDDAFSAAQDSARDFYDEMHEGNLKAIDDIRDRANAELDAQQKAIRGVVSAEQARINAVRAREQENELRADVASAEPEDKAAAQRALNRFLEDQRLGRMGASADIAIAGLEDQRANADAAAAMATAEANRRNREAQDAFNAEFGDLQKQMSRHPEQSAAIMRDIDRLVRGYTPAASAGSAAGLGSASSLTVSVPIVIYLDGEKITDSVERRQATLQSVYNPNPPRASGLV